MTRYFKKLEFFGLSDFQLNIKTYWCSLGIKTWPPSYTGRQKRSINFGIGYLCWRIK